MRKIEIWESLFVIAFLILFVCIIYLQLTEDNYRVSYGEIDNQYFKDDLKILVIDLQYEIFEFNGWRNGVSNATFHNYMLGDYVKVEYNIDMLGNLYLINIIFD